MGKFQGTPGPWVIGKIASAIVTKTLNRTEPADQAERDEEDYYGGKLICESVSEMNALLISSAPEMLDNLIDSRRKLSDLIHVLDKQYNLWSHHRQALYDICNGMDPVIAKALKREVKP